MADISRRAFVGGVAAVSAAAALGGASMAFASEKDGSSSGDDKKLPADGEYTESARGRNGMVTCVTTIKDGAISSVECTEQQETDVFAGQAIPQLCSDIAAANSFGVDSITGATWSSAAVKTCVKMAITEAGGDADAYDIPTSYPDAKDETLDVDVAVVGAGFSGIFAAARAAQAGAVVCLMDKSIVGGCSLQSGAVSVYDGDDAVRSKLDSWVSEQMYLVDSSLIHTYLANNKPMLDWAQTFTDSCQLFPDGLEFEGEPVGMLCESEQLPAFYEDMLDKTVRANGGSVYTGTTAQELLTSDGVVTGVVAQRKDGSTLTVNAKATVIATGGFGGDTSRIKELTGFDVVCGGMTQDVGEGMEMAWAAGAAKPARLGGLMLHQTLAQAQLTGYEFFQQQMPMILGYVPSLLDLDRAGRRFRNEDWVNEATAAAASGAFAGGVTYVLLDQAKVDALTTGGLASIGFDDLPGMPPNLMPDFESNTPWDQFQDVLDDTVAGGWGFKGDTLEELAQAAGMDPAILQATVDEYNGYCEAGSDTVFGKDATHLVAYGDGPLYLVGITYNQLGTVGGIEVNTQFQALDENRQAVPGLYAAGAEAYGTCWNRNYYGSGEGVGFAMTSGYVAGPLAAAYALEK